MAPKRPRKKADATLEAARVRARKPIGERIDLLVTERGLETKVFYGDMDWDKTMYSRKTRGKTPILPEEAVKAARLLGAPHGWPYITTQEGLLLEALGARVTEVLKHIKKIHELLDREAGKPTK